ncbi:MULTISPECIES: hypothetical protein [unclassified Methylobacterium]|jgi:hypothetical protein|uniref:hypothetical protein n=1 Tax=unclassified Methylobacterium TaxID=2615210 RepID=UPI0006B0029B|nr:hypothetical protein ADL19_04225 [Streptomyces purpurogeneiscleroticus]
MSRELNASADRIQALWEAGEICSLIGRAARARVLRAARLVDAGRLTPAEARSIAREAEGLAMSIAPLPEPPHD